MSTSAAKPNLGPGGTAPTVPTPKPLYPDTPWWAILIAVFATALVSVLGTAYALGGVSVPSGPTSLPPAASLVIDTITYFPHILLLFGVLGDMFTYDGVWSIPSLVGLLSIFLNYFMKYFWLGLQSLFTTAKKVAETGTNVTGQPAIVGGAGVAAFFKNYDGCSVQGFEGFATEFAPQTLVVTATVFCYYIFDLVRNRGWLNSLAAILIFGMVFLGQVAILSTTASGGSCGTGAYGGSVQALMALFEGIVFGGSAYGIVQTYYPTRLPTSTISPFPRRDRSDLTLGPDGKMYDADGYPYVVLPNGQTAPDMSSAQSRQAFASVVGNALGSGTPAVGAGCNA
jgi:hypothetical protein